MNNYQIQSVVKDPKIDCLNSKSDKDSIMTGFTYAVNQFSAHYKLLKEVDIQFKAALNAKNFMIARKKDIEFYQIADKVAYYDNESERLIKIWGQKTGGFCFTAGENGLQINFSSGEAVPITENEVNQIEEMLKEAVRPPTFIKSISLVKKN